MFRINQYNNLKEFVLGNEVILSNNRFHALFSGMKNLIYCEIPH
jgi:hypothetical protein